MGRASGVGPGARLASFGPVGLEHFDRDPAQLGQGLHQLLTQQTVGQQFDQGAGLREHSRATLWGRQIAVGAGLRNQLG